MNLLCQVILRRWDDASTMGKPHCHSGYVSWTRHSFEFLGVLELLATFWALAVRMHIFKCVNRCADSQFANSWTEPRTFLIKAKVLKPVPATFANGVRVTKQKNMNALNCRCYQHIISHARNEIFAFFQRKFPHGKNQNSFLTLDYWIYCCCSVAQLIRCPSCLGSWNIIQSLFHKSAYFIAI